MIVQEFIEWDQYVRCLCLGQRRRAADARTTRSERKYLVEHDHLDAGAAASASSTTR